MSPSTIPDDLPRSDVGNAKRLVREHGTDLRYCATNRRWLVWDGARWRVDDTGEVERRAKELVLSLGKLAHRIENDAARSDAVKFFCHSQNASRVGAMIQLARSEAEVAITLAALDRAVGLLTTPDGTLDLRTGELHPHAREHLITQITRARLGHENSDGDARAEWDAFVLQVCSDDTEQAAFLQRAIGYSLLGDPLEGKVFLAHGPTASGKSTFLESIKHAAGDYGRTMSFETLLAKAGVNGSGPREDIARLAGARFVVASEVDEGRHFAAGTLKSLTGNDTIVSRGLHQASFEHRPSYAIWLAANHLPQANANDDAIWRRIVCVPFVNQVPPGKRDLRLGSRLRTSRMQTAILRWMVEGAFAYWHGGLGVPASIDHATDKYRRKNDHALRFLEERCEFDEAASETKTATYEAYEAWALASGIRRPLSKNAFGARLIAEGFGEDRGTKGVRSWAGIALKSEGGDAQ